MFFFADACFLVALHHDKDNNHDEACEIWNKLLEKKMIVGYDNLCTTDYIIAEVFHILQNKIGFTKTLEHYNAISKNCNVVKVSYPETFQKAIDSKMRPFCNRKTKKPEIGLVDAISLIMMDKNKINYIISFDGHFKNIPLIFTIYDVQQLKSLI